MARQKSGVAEYRNYYLPYDFPVLLLSGEHWKISSVPSKNLHFHNCLVCVTQTAAIWNSLVKKIPYCSGKVM